MSPVQKKIQISTGGALNITKFIGTNSTFAHILGKLKKGLVDNRYTKLVKIGEKVLLIFGVAHINIPL